MTHRCERCGQRVKGDHWCPEDHRMTLTVEQETTYGYGWSCEGDPCPECGAEIGLVGCITIAHYHG